VPSVNIFLPPLLGGFLFVSLWYPLRYWTQREQGYKLVFAASIAGGLFLLIATFVTHYLLAIPEVLKLARWWHAIVPVPDSGKAFLAFILGATLWLPLNLAGRLFGLNKRRIVDWLIHRKGDPLELVLWESLAERQLVSVTLKSRKVYVGYVITNINPAHRIESVRLSLKRSGYRDENTHALTLDVDYEKTHAVLLEQVERAMEAEIENILNERPSLSNDAILDLAHNRVSRLPIAKSFETVILASEIVSVAPFEPEVFDSHFQRLGELEFFVTRTVSEVKEA